MILQMPSNVELGIGEYMNLIPHDLDLLIRKQTLLLSSILQAWMELNRCFKAQIANIHSQTTWVTSSNSIT